MSKLFKLVSGILAILMLLSSAACANTQETEEKTEAGETTSADTVAAETGESLNVERKDYNSDVKFLAGSNSEWTITEIWVEQDSADPIESAVFNRNLEIQDEYGIRITQELIEMTNLPTTVTAAVNSGSQDFIAIADSLMDMVTYSRKGQLCDLVDVPNLDFSKSWWDQKSIKGLSLGNHVFYATGDILTTDNDATFILMFNKTIMENKNIMTNIDQGGKNNSTIYQMVDNHEWTFDMMLQMETMAADQKDNLDPHTDQIGFAMTGNVPYSFLYGGGFVSCAKDEDDMPAYALDVELTSKICEEAYKVYADKALTANMETGGAGVFENGKQCFGGGHALFFGEVLQCVSRLRGFDVEFGVIPYPMLSTAQKDYYTVMNPIGGMVAIPKSLTEDNAALAGALLEIMAAKSQKYLTKAYYDITLIGKGTRDAESEPMIDLILKNRVYDLGYVYGWGGLVSNLGGCISSGNKVASTIKSAEGRFNKAIQSEFKKMKID